MREPPARARRGRVALELRAQLLLADDRQDLALLVEHVVGVLAVAVEHEVERVELTGEPAIEARAVAHVVLDRLVGAPDLALGVDRDRLAVERGELPAAVLELAPRTTAGSRALSTKMRAPSQRA